MPMTCGRRPEVFLKKYATRLARLCLIRCQCDEGHPVLATELHLVDMARSKLREELLSRSPMDVVQRMREDLEFEIRQTAKEYLCGMVVDAEVRDRASARIDDADLADLFVMAN